MYISYIIYIILNSRCYTGVRAPKLSHRSSYIKEPFGKGLDGLPGGWTGASEGLEGGLRGLRPVQGGWRRASRGLRRASGGLGGLLEGGFKGAWEGLQEGFKGAWEGLEGGFKGAWRGLEKGFKGASRGLEKGFKGASRGLQALLTFVPPPPPGEGPFKPPLKGTFEGGGSEPAALRALLLQPTVCPGLLQQAFRLHLFWWLPTFRLASYLRLRRLCSHKCTSPILLSLSEHVILFEAGPDWPLRFPVRGEIHCQVAGRLVCWLRRLLHDVCRQAWHLLS